MSDLIQFAKHVKDQLARSDRQPHWEAGAAERYMSEVNVRREQFTELASRLVSKIIAPRLEVLASYFPNAVRAKDEPADHCSYWFGYSERFPASTKLSFGVEHDVRFERAALFYAVSMSPLFLKLNERDKLIMNLGAFNELEVVDWVEARLFDFLDAYLQIDRGGREFEDEADTDPVCGMRIGRSSAVATGQYTGHSYFFCSQNCADQFAQNPRAFVDVRLA